MGAGALAPEQVLARLASRPDGLSTAEVLTRRAQYGLNSLGTRRVRPTTLLLRQLRNPILILLMMAALVSAITGGGTNAVIIGVIVVMSVGLSFFNEFRAEVAMETLRAKITLEIEVRRDATVERIPVTDLVPGDIVTLRIGTLIPADLRLLVVNELECDEAVLTGESLPVVKSIDATTSTEAFDQPGCAYMGTVVHQGSGTGVVVQTGLHSEFGKIAAGLAQDQTRTAFELGLARFSRMLFIVAALLTGFVFAANIILSRPIIDALLFSLAIAVGIAPEMMPAIVTVSLAAGSRALVAKKVLVKRLVAIEDLGNIEILFTDKTGTLTEGTITFARSLDANGQPSDHTLQLGLVCNEALVVDDKATGGSSLDQALWDSVATEGATSSMRGVAVRAGQYRMIDTLPFDHERQMVSVLVNDSTDSRTIVTKGAPEVVLSRCLDVSDAATQLLRALFSEGARVVAVASRPAPGEDALGPLSEQSLVLEGFLTFVDRPKGDAGASIKKLQDLGVEVKIITGDNGLVAQKVCTDIGLACTGILTGAEVKALSDEDLTAAIATTTVFARVGPEQKSRIIDMARSAGRDVAYLGDGVNDAVALHHADVGISVDSATDVAKDAADVVLLDKDLGVLAEGVMEGRRIFANTMKYVLMATSSNFGNMFSAAGASVFLAFLPMLPSQILLNNLLYDAGQLVIPTDHVDAEVLRRPAAWNMGFIRRFMSVFGPVSSIFDFLTFFVMLKVLHANHVGFRTGWFVESLATQTLVIYVIRTRRIPFLKSRPSRLMLFVPTGAALIGAILPYTGLSRLLGFKPLPAAFFLILFAMVVVYLVLVEFAKTFFYRTSRAVTPPAPSHALRHERHLRRRASHFVHHPAPTARRASTRTLG